MRRALLCLVLPVLLFCSCKKEHSASTNPASKKYQVNFNVSGFTDEIMGSAGGRQQVNALRTDASGIAGSIDVLYYYAYNSVGTQISHVYQDSTYSDFGNITDSLEAGTYTIVFAGGKPGMNINSAYIEGYGTTIIPWKDTFFQESTLTVSGGNINQNINMNRIVAELSIDILDQIPATATKIVLTVSQDYEYYSFSTQTPNTAVSPRTTTFTLPSSVLGTSNYKNSIIMLNTITPFTVTIVCYDSKNDPLGQATISNVTLQPNTETILSGDLFGNSTGFTTTLNHTWDPGTINYPF